MYIMIVAHKLIIDTNKIIKAATVGVFNEKSTILDPFPNELKTTLEKCTPGSLINNS